jgi:hypothetical protein
MGHMVAPELNSQEGRDRSQGTHSSAGAHLTTEARSGATGHKVAPEPTSVERCGHVVAPKLSSQEGRARSQGTRGSVGAHLNTEVRSRVAGHVMAPEPTSAWRYGLKL